MTPAADCPHCGAVGLVNSGVCSNCGNRSKAGRRVAPRPVSSGRCKHPHWSEPTRTTVAGEVRQRCLRCGGERQVETEAAR